MIERRRELVEPTHRLHSAHDTSPRDWLRRLAGDEDLTRELFGRA